MVRRFVGEHSWAAVLRATVSQLNAPRKTGRHSETKKKRAYGVRHDGTHRSRINDTYSSSTRGKHPQLAAQSDSLQA